MTIDTTITVGNLLTIAAFAFTVVAGWFLLRGDVASTKEDVVDLKERLATAEGAVSSLKDRIEQVRAKGADELAKFQLQAAEKYATHAGIKEVEERVVEAINRLGDRFDKYFDRAAPGSRRRGGSSHNG